MPNGLLAALAELATINTMRSPSNGNQAGAHSNGADERRPELVWVRYRCDLEHRDRIKRLCRRRGIDQSTLLWMLVKKALDREELEQFDYRYRNLFGP